MEYRTVRSIYVDGTFWNAYVEDGNWISRDWATRDVAKRAQVAAASVQDHAEYDVETCTTDAGQHVRETIQIFPC